MRLTFPEIVTNDICKSVCECESVCENGAYLKSQMTDIPAPDYFHEEREITIVK